jgi:hypothetical protein
MHTDRPIAEANNAGLALSRQRSKLGLYRHRPGDPGGQSRTEVPMTAETPARSPVALTDVSTLRQWSVTFLRIDCPASIHFVAESTSSANVSLFGIPDTAFTDIRSRPEIENFRCANPGCVCMRSQSGLRKDRKKPFAKSFIRQTEVPTKSSTGAVRRSGTSYA